jgi:flagellar motor switch protein FliM
MMSAPSGDGASNPTGTGRPVAPVLVEVLGVAARRLRARLSARTGRDIPVRVNPSQMVTLADIMEAGPAGEGLWCLFRTVSADPDAAPALLLVDAALLPALVCSMFGAPEDDTVDRPGRGASEIERVIGSRICRELMESIVAGWAGGPTPKLVPGETASSSRVCDDLDPSTRYVVTQVDVGNPSALLGTLQVALPAVIVPGALASVRAPRPAPPPPPVAPVPETNRGFDRLLPIELDLIVELGRMTVPVRLLRGLAVGDEIPLRLTGETTARVNDRAALIGEAGTQGGLRSLRVTSRANYPSTPEVGDR